MWYIAIPVIVAAILAVVIYFLWKKEMKVSPANYSDFEGPLTVETVKSWFPLSVFVSQDIINNSDIHRVSKCIGANSLKSVMPKSLSDRITWGRTQGHINLGGNDIDWVPIHVNSGEIDMMEITKPQWVTISLEEEFPPIDGYVDGIRLRTIQDF